MHTKRHLTFILLLALLTAPVAVAAPADGDAGLRVFEIPIEDSTYIGEVATLNGYRAIPVATPSPMHHATLVLQRPDGRVSVENLDDWAVNGVRLVATGTEPELQMCGIRQGSGWECQLRSFDGRVRWSSKDLPADLVEQSRDLDLTAERWWLLAVHATEDGQVAEVHTGRIGEVVDAEGAPLWSRLVTWREMDKDVRFEFPQLALTADQGEAVVNLGPWAFAIDPESGQVSRSARSEDGGGGVPSAWPPVKDGVQGRGGFSLPSIPGLDWNLDSADDGGKKLVIREAQRPWV